MIFIPSLKDISKIQKLQCYERNEIWGMYTIKKY